MKRSAFTIIELLVSIMIIGILATFGYQQYTKAILKANAAGLINQLKSIEAGMAKYYANTGTLPLDLTYLFTAPDKGYSPAAPATIVPIDATNAKAIDLIGFVDGGTVEPTVKDYWGGPYIEKVDTEELNPKTGLKVALGYSNPNPLSCTAGVIAPATGVTDINCIKAKLGGRICVGAKIDTVTGESFNILVVDRINFDMAKELFVAANGKAPAKNAAEVAENKVSDKLGIGDPANYAAETGCVIWRYYDAALIK